MIKKDIVDRLYESHGGMTFDEAEEYTNEILDILRTGMLSEDGVTVAGFGRFRHKERAVREVTMPNGEKKLSASGTRIQFLPSPALKAYINSDEEL